jgi:hypothetical protein
MISPTITRLFKKREYAMSTTYAQNRWPPAGASAGQYLAALEGSHADSESYHSYGVKPSGGGVTQLQPAEHVHCAAISSLRAGASRGHASKPRTDDSRRVVRSRPARSGTSACAAPGGATTTRSDLPLRGLARCLRARRRPPTRRPREPDALASPRQKKRMTQERPWHRRFLASTWLRR